MHPADWKPTACNLCYANCGILAQLDETGRVITKIKGDRLHPASQGYTCNKAARIDYYQNGRDRLTSPLRRRPDGAFEAIDWDTAIAEIATRFRDIKVRYGGDKILYYGGGGQGNHLGGSYSQALRNALGMKYRSNAIAQEKTGLFWMCDRVLGGAWHGDFHHCDVAIIVGKNPWQSNGLQRARVLMRDIARDPARTLVVLDPRRSETAAMADIHLAVRPGTDVWCIAAILGYLVQSDLLDLEWVYRHTVGHERILDQLRQLPVEDYARFAGIPMAQVEAVAQVMARTRKIALYEDIGVQMSPYSTLCSYLDILLFALPGAYDVQGGVYLASGLASVLGSWTKPGRATADSDGYDRNRPVTPVTGARIVGGLVPCNSIPEEIVTDHPDRFRAVLVESANPLHSLADSKRFREAFAALDLSVVIDVAFTETAAAADYVLPAASQYEKAEATFFPTEFPENFFHLRRPLMAPLPGTMTEAEIYARLLEQLQVFAPGELDPLRQAAGRGLDAFADAMFQAMAEPKVSRHISYVLYRTLGPALPAGATEAASLWGLCQQYAATNAGQVRAAGFAGEGAALGNSLFRGIVDAESGLVVSRSHTGAAEQWRKPDRKLHLLVAEMSDELDSLRDYKLPERSREFPLLLCAGERRSYTANTIIRDPAWTRGDDAVALHVHPTDAIPLGLQDASAARLVTRRGEALVTIAFDDGMQPGTVSLPNGTGLGYPDATGNTQVAGVAPNELTDLDDRDPWVGTPYHKHVRARLEPVTAG